ncbi:hypothetical protein CMI39_00165 [Candidatus Pacearchaeota archaeon]|mgnify:CR=1 FL=1|jgi:thymidylate synthase (FAD)|nr:hypothetical protein [Candidatus Pacearchaeota archaeon]|tara:strand:+ start:3819 stop:4409 length:591 start_codon:yes stop_codon:yes gene_type:complete
MEIQLIASTNKLKDTKDMKKFSRDCARVCYTSKDFEQLREEVADTKLTDRLLRSGHHSVFEHINLTFYMKNIPKIFAMILNNEKQYATSEKSARYTQMKTTIPLQKEKYNKWMKILIPKINEVFPKIKKGRDEVIKKLAQENARYMTSVFTPTKMVHTVNLRQLNFIMQGFEENIIKYRENKNPFFNRLPESLGQF